MPIEKLILVIVGRVSMCQTKSKLSIFGGVKHRNVRASVCVCLRVRVRIGKSCPVYFILTLTWVIHQIRVYADAYGF